MHLPCPEQTSFVIDVGQTLLMSAHLFLIQLLNKQSLSPLHESPTLPVTTPEVKSMHLIFESPIIPT